MNYIGIDFSINSPGICLFTEVSNNYKFINFTNTTKPVEKLKLHYNLYVDVDCFDLVTYLRDKKNDDYATDQLNKIKNAQDLAYAIVIELESHIILNYKVKIGIEGYSYGSRGNAFIDLIAFNSVLRNKLYNRFGNVSVFSPSQIKKHAGKGNANKLMMFNYFLENALDDKVLENNAFWLWCHDNKDKCFNKKGDIVKPLDDIVDSYFVCKYLIDLE